jgi:putative membrane protein
METEDGVLRSAIPGTTFVRLGTWIVSAGNANIFSIGGKMSADKKSLLAEDPRVPLAAERTFLAWIRTGLALMGFGFVVARFGLFLRELAAVQKIPQPLSHGTSLWLGLGLVALGVVLNVAALVRYRRYLKDLAAGILPQPKARLESLVAVALTVLGLATILSLLVVAF